MRVLPHRFRMLDFVRERLSEKRNGGTSRDSPPYLDRLRARHTGEYRCSSLMCRQVGVAKKGGTVAGMGILMDSLDR